MLNFNSVRVYLQANYLFLKSYYSATRSPERNHFRHYYSLLRSQRGNQQRCQTSVFKVSKQLFKERKKREKSVPFRTTVRNRAGGETTSENYIIRSNISDRSSAEQINTPEESYIIHSCPNSNISRVEEKQIFQFAEKSRPVPTCTRNRSIPYLAFLPIHGTYIRPKEPKRA